MPYIGNTAANRFVASKAASVFSGDGSTTAFTLDHAVGSDEDILVSVDGVIQEPSVAFSVSGTTLTFTAAPSSNSGNNIFVYYLFRTVGTVSHPSSNALQATSGTFTGNVVIPDAGNIGSASDTDAMSISSGGVVTFSQNPVGAFISMADQWRLTGSTNEGTNADVTGTWERVDTSGWGGIGTGLTDSSGVFSFASTGIHLIIFTAEMFTTSGDGSGSLTLDITTDNSNFNTASQVSNGNSGGGSTTNQSGTNFFLFDVTNTTTHKFKFVTTSMATNTKLNGNSTSSRTGFSVIRLGGT